MAMIGKLVADSANCTTDVRVVITRMSVTGGQGRIVSTGKKSKKTDEGNKTSDVAIPKKICEYLLNKQNWWIGAVVEASIGKTDHDMYPRTKQEYFMRRYIATVSEGVTPAMIEVDRAGDEFGFGHVVTPGQEGAEVGEKVFLTKPVVDFLTAVGALAGSIVGVALVENEAEGKQPWAATWGYRDWDGNMLVTHEVAAKKELQIVVGRIKAMPDGSFKQKQVEGLADVREAFAALNWKEACRLLGEKSRVCDTYDAEVAKERKAIADKAAAEQALEAQRAAAVAEFDLLFGGDDVFGEKPVALAFDGEEAAATG